MDGFLIFGVVAKIHFYLKHFKSTIFKRFIATSVLGVVGRLPVLR
jgi:hypothetical protein